jgi:hypothetical protein
MTRRVLKTVIMAVTSLLTVITGVALDPTAAFAHDNIVSGVATCSQVGGKEDITWTIANDYNLSETASVYSATGGVGTVSGSPVNIPASPSQPYKSATMTQVLPGTTTGTDTLTVKGVWSDNYSTTDSGSVSLPTNCKSPTPSLATTPSPTTGSAGASTTYTDMATVTGIEGITPTGR